MEEPLQHHEDTTIETGNEKPPSTFIHRKKNKIRNLIFAVLAGMATFSIVGKPWPEPRPLPKEKAVTKSLAREVLTPEKTGGLSSRVYDRNGELIFEEHSKNLTPLSKHMFHNGKPFGLYPEEKEKNPDLTPKEYLAFLAEALDSHEKLDIFFREFWEYMEDSMHDTGSSFRNEVRTILEDYVQTPEETLMRIKNGRMQGECDDVAYFSYVIISQQEGRNPHMISRGDHFYTVWVEERGQGRYDAFNITNAGLECNGNFYDPSQDTGQGTYGSVTDALTAILRDYKPDSLYYKCFDAANQPPYIIYTIRPIVTLNHDMGIPRLVPVQAFHPKYPFLWSYDEIYLTITAAAVTGTMIKKWRKRRKKKNVNQT